MNTLMNIGTNIKLLGEILSHSFSGFNSSLDLDRLSVFIKELLSKRVEIQLETELKEDHKYFFKTVVLNLEDYLGLNNERVDFSRIYTYLNQEKDKSIKAGHYESASIINHVYKRILEIESSEKGMEEIAELFQLLPPYKLMKYDIKEKADKITLTVITSFEPYLKSLREVL
ncbi:hypothetical protein [Plebeiibacterium sediminum]|uniref:Uncharacterized protein n=1 Tax=Plebeiibacterium sediminum TaxID=2992112 RepID=A0AAE3SEU3_9BACT|nr:hypothetical protein [Plebeiobacterium sediminum]MCW3786853.1 hypothetical protein [Plebeiobacterium sediminum]